MRHFLLFAMLIVIAVAARAYAQDQDIVIDDRLGEQFGSSALSATQVHLSNSAALANRSFFHQWAGKTLSFAKAYKRTTERLNRTAYWVDHAPRALPRLGRSSTAPSRVISKGALPPIQLTLVQEEPFRFHFRTFPPERKVTTLPKEKLVALAKKYVTQNHLVRETKCDRVGKVTVFSRRVNAEQPEGNPPEDYAVMQVVHLERTYRGLPVVNSRLILAVLPDTLEIVGVWHLNWTPLVEKSEAPLPPASIRLKDWAAIKTKLSEQIRLRTRSFGRAEVNDMYRAWYQAPEGLVPVLVTPVDVQFIGERITRRQMDIINLQDERDILTMLEGPKGTSPVQLPE